MTTTRKQKKVATQIQLLESAAKCFSEKGFRGTGMAELANSVGMSTGNLYRYFPDKEAFITTLVEDEMSGAITKMNDLDDSESPLRNILGVISSCIFDPGYPMDHRLWIEILAETARNERLRTVFKANDSRMRTAFKHLLQQAMKKGLIADDIDPDGTSIWLYALVDGMIARTAIDPDFDFSVHIDLFNKLVTKALSK
ncbi:TetR/AcrR family transcriptional regulator [Limnobaculum zhutongyuii]|uniref:TetR/AcrR family transcriptional regulator n=1 Tax=Limnobaculum zhutongyuii TaxID=2498113 RepID=A0A411WJJ4_9GAMM|nr:TetR/AcrR family transcriptional regulator [Limnobaculum zhutongyuii]QBH96328.1 TetR/AcrR family transcriptional regulator [Limnobaculum zhutongyuii]TQS87083.1 TetR/AcrR family transcriptional regulator [Limnobaculum zhutongyuii]